MNIYFSYGACPHCKEKINFGSSSDGSGGHGVKTSATDLFSLLEQIKSAVEKNNDLLESLSRSLSNEFFRLRDTVRNS